MTNDINDVLAKKRAWQKGDPERRSARRIASDLLRAQREHESKVKEIERPQIFNASILAGCMFLALIAMLVFCKSCHAEDINLNIISKIESNNNPMAKNGKHIGMYQIGQSVINDYNNAEFESMQPVVLQDMYNPIIAKAVANWYLNFMIPIYFKKYNISDTITNRILAWNWGIGHLRKLVHHGSKWNILPLESRKYIVKYFKYEQNLL